MNGLAIGKVPRDRDPDRIAVIIPVHDRREKTLRCLASLHAATLEGFELDVIVVDDGSTDGTSEAISMAFPSVRILSGSGNLYWTGAVNLGIREALAREADFVVLLNDDTVQDPEFLVRLHSCARSRPGAIIGGLILRLGRPDTIRFGGARWSFRRKGWYYPDEGRPAGSVGNDPYEVDSISGNCCLVPAPVLAKYGFYDERNFPHCYADAVYAIEVRKRGVPLIVEPRARVFDDTSDVEEKLTGPRLEGWPLIRHVFLTKRSAYYWRNGFRFYWRTAPNKAGGVVLALFRLVRISARVFLALAGLRPFYPPRGSDDRPLPPPDTAGAR